jgi:hypothetical protein
LNIAGAGGGYNERDNVEYNERRCDSDGEYDEVRACMSMNEKPFNNHDSIVVRTKEEKRS